MSSVYVGRFAPTPSGPLHAGSLVAALGSWLDARTHAGRWLVRIDDADTPRNVAGAAEAILDQLERCGLRADAPVSRQSQHTARYAAALETLIATHAAYPCACTRRELDAAADAAPGGRDRNEDHVYPGTCRHGVAGRTVRSWRLRVDGEAASKLGNDGPRIEWRDRRLGLQCQDVPREIGDFVLKRADGVWAYQLAVVVDDAAEGITDVVRGEDLASNTVRQIVLQGKLGLPTPRYLHLPLVRGADGEKLSKQNGAVALAVDAPLDALRQAGRVLGVEVMGSNVAEWLAQAASAWPYRRLG